ncbi:hypothetical protein D3C81_1521060 [compost metagenome]
MLVGGVVLRQPAIVGKGRQFATGLAQGDMQLFGVHVAAACQVMEIRVQPVHHLQQGEIGCIGDTGLVR